MQLPPRLCLHRIPIGPKHGRGVLPICETLHHAANPHLSSPGWAAPQHTSPAMSHIRDENDPRVHAPPHKYTKPDADAPRPVLTEVSSQQTRGLAVPPRTEGASNGMKRLLTELTLTMPPEPKKTKIEYVWEDLDEEDADDPLMVSEYVVGIFDYLSVLERKTLPDAQYLQWQRNIRPKMRLILVDWMVEVHLRFRLLPETLFLAINIMDRFMLRELVQVERLQLLATGLLFIAAKYEEVYLPSVKSYAYVTDGGYDEEMILEAEKYILQALEYDLLYPNPMNFLRRILKADDYDVQLRTLGKYLLEISVIDHRFIGLLPLMCAAGAMYIARKMLGRPEWTGNLIHYSGGYHELDLRRVCELLAEYLVAPIVHEEFFKKYASKKFLKASIVARSWAKRLVADGKDIMD